SAERLRRLCERWIYGPEGVSRPAGCRTPRPRAAGALLAATDGRRRCCHSRVPETAGVPSRIGVKALRKAIQALPENVEYARHVVAGGAASCDQESMQRSSFGERTYVPIRESSVSGGGPAWGSWDPPRDREPLNGERIHRLVRRQEDGEIAV